MARRSARRFELNRRRLLQAFAVGVGAGALGRSRPALAADGDPCFLIVLPAFGGGAIIDSFLPLRQSECADGAVIDCFPDAEVVDIAGSPIRAADAVIDSVIGLPLDPPMTIPLSPFANKHKDDMMVCTVQHTSVNHAIAQHRAITGGGSAWAGRTLQECVAIAYGEGVPLPNVNMASLGFLSPGSDDSIPSWAKAEAIVQPVLKPLSLSTDKGIPDTPPGDLIELARSMRDDHLDPESSFYQTFRLSQRLQLWKAQREDARLNLQPADLIDKLLFVPDSPPAIPLAEYGLTPSEDAELLLQTFPDILGAQTGTPDPLEQQAALAYLLLKNRISVAVTISPSLSPLTGGPTLVKNPPLAFDGSHNDHRSAQAIMWARILGIADKLIDLLKNVPFDSTQSMWDRTMIHFATDFGRGKRRPGATGSWGTAHDLNNGTLTVSPLVNGNSVLGGVVKNTSVDEDGHTYGFDLATGAPDPSRRTSEAEMFAGLVQALGIDTGPANLPDVPAMRKS